MSDDRKYQRQRRRLVDHLRENKITDERVLAAIGAVPRHEFVEPALRARAYEDEALPIGMSQTISQPFTVAYQTMLLSPEKGDRILEIGTGSGYQAAVLCEMGARVFSIERHRPLLDRTRSILDSLGYRVVLKHGDGTLGWPAFAPFDGIVVTAGASDVPEPLLNQLRIEGEDGKPAGRLVIPIGDEKGQKMNLFRRVGGEEFEREEAHIFRFVPLVGKEGGL
ncbi:MAG: protein-L-isoaspartate(D-aspartate) O-methyltransferase [Rhodothermales bacterium]